MSAKVFVGNLNFETTPDELQEALSQSGEVVDLYLPADRATGRPRGFAIVTFSNEDEAMSAIETLDGFELGGRKLRINAAEDRPPRIGGFKPPGGGAAGKHAKRKGKGSRRGLRGKKRSL